MLPFVLESGISGEYLKANLQGIKEPGQGTGRNFAYQPCCLKALVFMVSPLFGLDTGIPLALLESVISLFRNLIKPAPIMLQTAREGGGERCLLYGTGEMLAVPSAVMLKDLLCVIPQQITRAGSLIPNFKLFPGLCVS